MATPIVVNEVCRFTINGTYLDAPVANVIDLACSGLGRSQTCATAATHLATAWETRILPVLSNRYSANSVRYVDLDSLDGPTGEVTKGDGDSWPRPGAIGGQPYAGAMAILVRKTGTAVRGQRAGRLFLVPPGEADVEGNEIGVSYLSALNVALTAFVDDLDTVVNGVAISPVTVHKRPGGVGYSASDVTGLTASARLTTQRRRGKA